MRSSCRCLILAVLILGFSSSEPSVRAQPVFSAPTEGYSARVGVQAATRIDWTFVLANQSQVRPPAGWLPADYDSTKQTYELYVPRRRDAKALIPAIVFISTGTEPTGWNSFKRICQARGILFAGTRNAGNDCPEKKRTRIVLDVLDDLRRKYPIDPDRTYLAGISGGARMAGFIGFALPEYFGGVLSICAGEDLRKEPWLRHRVRDRLSVALLTGERDFNHAEVTRLRGPYLEAVGIRTKVWVQPGLGHSMPNERILQEAYLWLEAGLPKRKELAKKFPASRIAANAAPDRAEQAKALLDEGKGRVEKKEGLYPGLMLLEGVQERWPDTEAGAEAKKILLEYQEKPDRPWEAEDIAEQRRFLIAEARGLDAYASGKLDPVYQKQRRGVARSAMHLWMRVLADRPDSPEGMEAKKRIPELKKLAGEPEPKE
jgi:hypothetical protein